jgi:hypothetical protein
MKSLNRTFFRHESSDRTEDLALDTDAHWGVCDDDVLFIGTRFMFSTAVPIIKLFAWGEGNSGGRVLRDDEPRPS